MSEFIPSDPVDPKPSTTGANFTPLGGGTYFYFAANYGGDKQWYIIVFGLEDGSHPAQLNDGARSCDGTYWHYGTDLNGIMTVGGNCAF